MKIEVDFFKPPTNRLLSRSQKFKNIKTFKNLCLITAFTASCIAISIALFIPKSKQYSQFSFPEQVPLLNWRSLTSENLAEATKNGAIAAKRYSYISSTQEELRIDVLYINRGVNLSKDLEMVGLSRLSNRLNRRYLEAIGHYILFSDQDRAYLSACINPRGDSTVTEAQFTQNQNAFDITPDRFGLYLLGVKELRDTRCLFVIMSIPLASKNTSTNLTSDIDYQKLERAWINWYKNSPYKFPET